MTLRRRLCCSPPAGCKPNGTKLSVTAQGIAFNEDCLAAPADKPFTIAFDNKDPGTPHNVAIYPDEASATDPANALFAGEVFPGPETRTYDVPAIKKGDYFFHCDVHPTQMNGTFVSG